MKLIASILMLMILSSCAAQPSVTTQSSKSSLPDLGVAPELESDTWINVDTPLKLADLRGKVVLLDMWTYG